MIRKARAKDLEGLLTLEHICFPGDRISRRAMRYMLTNRSAKLLVYELDGALAGYILMLLHARSKLARFYSLAVNPLHRGKRIASLLMAAAEELARKARKHGVKLEVRQDNADASRLYDHLGYRLSGVKQGYYEDGEAALVYVKTF